MKTIYAIYKYPDNGYEYDKQYAAEHLTLNKKYKILNVDMGQSATYLALDICDKVRCFNSVHFDIVDEFGNLYDIWDDEDFNPYL